MIGVSDIVFLSVVTADHLARQLSKIKFATLPAGSSGLSQSSPFRIYGSLGAVVGFMTWIWLSVVIVLIGAELDAAIEKRTSREFDRRVVRHRPI